MLFFSFFRMPFSSEKVNETKRKCSSQARVHDLHLHSSTLADWSRFMHKENLNEKSKTDVPFHGDTLFIFFLNGSLKKITVRQIIQIDGAFHSKFCR